MVTFAHTVVVVFKRRRSNLLLPSLQIRICFCCCFWRNRRSPKLRLTTAAQPRCLEERERERGRERDEEATEVKPIIVSLSLSVYLTLSLSQSALNAHTHTMQERTKMRSHLRKRYFVISKFGSQKERILPRKICFSLLCLVFCDQKED